MKVLLQSGTRSVRAELGRELKRGAAGCIHEVVGRPDLVAKVYFDPVTGAASTQRASGYSARIDAMLRNPPHIGAPHQEGGRSFHQLAWPTDHVLRRSDALPLGFVMPMLPLHQACDLEAILTRRSREREGLPQELIVRLFVARNLAAVVRELHRAGHYVIDMKPKNMSVYKVAASPGLIALLDADGFCIYGGPGERYPAEMFTSEYIAPELLEANRKPTEAREAQDRWALAVIIFRLLNENIHPNSGTFVGPDNPTIDDNVREWRYAYGRVPSPELRANPLSIHEFFDDDTRELFDRAFARDPHARPEAREWRNHLDRFIDPAQGRLIRCKSDPSHWHFSKGCGLCYREGALRGKRNPQVSVPPSYWTPSTARANPPAARSAARAASSTPSLPASRPARSRIKTVASWTLGVLLTVFAIATGISVMLQMSAERAREAAVSRSSGMATQLQVSDRYPVVNLRSGPGEGYPAIGQIPAGEMVTRTEVVRTPTGEWTKVTWRGRTGYVASFRLTTPTTAAARDRTAAAPAPADPGTKRPPSTSAPPQEVNSSKPMTTSRPGDRPVAEPAATAATGDHPAPTVPGASSTSTPVSREPAERASQERSGSATDTSPRTPPAPASSGAATTPPKPAEIAAQTPPAAAAPGSTAPRQTDNDALTMECQGWVTKGRYAMEDSSYDAALAYADQALRLRPKCPGAAELRQEAWAAKQSVRGRTGAR